MKRFLLFTFDEYYPSGGWADFVDSFETIEEARTRATTRQRDEYQIVDGAHGTVIESSPGSTV